MLLAVGIISTSVFVVDPGHWTQVRARRGGTGRLLGWPGTVRVCWERREGDDASHVCTQERGGCTGNWQEGPCPRWRQRLLTLQPPQTPSVGLLTGEAMPVLPKLLPRAVTARHGQQPSPKRKPKPSKQKPNQINPAGRLHLLLQPPPPSLERSTRLSVSWCLLGAAGTRLLPLPQVVEHLKCITGITSQSILEFSYAVLAHVMDDPSAQQLR